MQMGLQWEIGDRALQSPQHAELTAWPSLQSRNATTRSTNLSRIGAFAAARVALKDVKFHIQHGLAVFQAATLAVYNGKSPLGHKSEAFSFRLPQLKDTESTAIFTVSPGYRICAPHLYDFPGGSKSPSTAGCGLPCRRRDRDTVSRVHLCESEYLQAGKRKTSSW